MKLKTKILNFKENYNRRAVLLKEKGIFYHLKSSSGYVLILVLLITTLLISVSGEFIVVSQTTIKYMQKFDRRTRAAFLAKSGVELGKYILKADKIGINTQMITGKKTNKNIDCYDDIWAVDFPGLPFDEGTLKIRISDENSKINLSVLSNEFVEKTRYYEITQRFFLNMGLPMDFADIIIDWVDVDDSRFSYGAESSGYYQTLKRPYSAKNGEMDSIDEMLLMKDITPEIYYGIGGGNFGLEENLVEHNRGDVSLGDDKLKDLIGGSNLDYDENKGLVKIGKEKSRKLSDYFRVNGYRKDFLNDYNKININTASFRVISALTENMSDDIVTDIINHRMFQPYTAVSDLKEQITDDIIRDKYLSVKSYIFKIVSTARVDGTTVTVTAIYNREKKHFLYWSEE